MWLSEMAPVPRMATLSIKSPRGFDHGADVFAGGSGRSAAARGENQASAVWVRLQAFNGLFPDPFTAALGEHLQRWHVTHEANLRAGQLAHFGDRLPVGEIENLNTQFAEIFVGNRIIGVVVKNSHRLGEGIENLLQIR